MAKVPSSANRKLGRGVFDNDIGCKTVALPEGANPYARILPEHAYPRDLEPRDRHTEAKFMTSWISGE